MAKTIFLRSSYLYWVRHRTVKYCAYQTWNTVINDIDSAVPNMRTDRLYVNLPLRLSNDRVFRSHRQ